MSKNRKAFTIIELLIVLVIISILATLTIVAYSGITSKANTASLQATLTNDKTLLANYFNTYGAYPLSLDGNYCPASPSTIDNAYCLESPTNTTLNYSATAQSFSLHATQGSTTYKITDALGAQPIAVNNTCPVGFISVPGSSTYGTSDFCVMKYEAKADDNGDGVGDTNNNSGQDTWPASTYPISSARKLVSTPAGYPVGNISQATSLTSANSTNNMVYGCPAGCHLITEAEWMTVAQNVLSVPSNWSSGTIGSGYIYSGHNDGSPLKALQADANDTNGYVNTGNSSGNQRRTLTLTNGEVIWDFAGDLSEWTAGQTTGGQPGLSSSTGFAFREWTALDITGSLAINPFPSSTGLSGSNTWNSTNGIGQVNSSSADSSARVFLRGSFWNGGSRAGLLALELNYTSTTSTVATGLRVSR